MNSYKQQIIKSFDKADLYEQSAYIQKIVVKRLISFIKKTDIDTKKPLSILEIGCGTGLLTQYLLELFPNANFIITDISPYMVERVKKKFKKNHLKIQFKIMDGEDIHLDQSFDLIVSSLAFQWFENLRDSLQKIVKLLKFNGYLFCSTLAKESFKEWREIYNKHQYSCSFQAYPDLETLESYWPYQIGGGFWSKEVFIETVEDGIEFIKGLRSIGANTPTKTHCSLSASQFYKVINQFNSDYRYSTYEVAFGCFRRFSAHGFFITGTDTDVGKTFVSACLTKALNATYWKPIQTGLNCDCGDTKTVQTLTNIPQDHIIPPLIELQAPVSPEEAAKYESRSLNLDKLDVSLLQPNKFYIVEGAGGVFVPIAEAQFMIQLMQKINLPVLIVARTKLGTLNHTLLTINTLRACHIPIAGVILNGNHSPANKEAIERHGKVKVIAEIPHMVKITDNFITQLLKEISLFY